MRKTSKNYYRLKSMVCALAVPTVFLFCATPLSNATPVGVSLFSADNNAAAEVLWTQKPVAQIIPVAPQTSPVTLAKAKSELWSEQVEASGNIMPWQENHIGTEIGGLRLESVLISVGDTVAKGQVLARLGTATVETDLDAANAQLMEAEGALAQAVSTSERAKRLAPSGGVSKQDLTLYETQQHTAEARVNAARSQVKRQQLRLQFTTLVAPDDGVISSSSASEGAIVQAGSELFRLIRQGRLEWRAEVKGEILLKLAAGQEVTVNSPLGQEVKGRIRRLSPTIDVTTGNGLVYVDLPAGTNLKAGLNVTGTINMGKRKILVLPSGAVIGDGKNSKVLKVGHNNKIEAIAVRIGRSRDNRVEVVAGLDENSLVVVGDANLVRVGEFVDASASAQETESRLTEKDSVEK